MGDNKLVSWEMSHRCTTPRTRARHAPPDLHPNCPHYTCYDFTWAACIVCIIDRIAEISSTWKVSQAIINRGRPTHKQP